MAAHIDYYLSLNSPWAYLGHERLRAIARRHGATVSLIPVDFNKVVFPATGGLPLPKRSAQRQAYRLMELQRWRDHLGLPLNLHPAHWPIDERLATGAVMVARDRGEDAANLAGGIMRAIWAEERDVADPTTLEAIAEEQGIVLDGLLDAAGECEPRWLEASQAAIARGVFGAPSYVIGDEIFWGQDRLEFVDRSLGAP